MSIERRRGGVIVFVCDTCDKRLETGTDEWDDAKGMAQRDAWAFKKIGRDWLHGCVDCGVE